MTEYSTGVLFGVEWVISLFGINMFAFVKKVFSLYDIILVVTV